MSAVVGELYPHRAKSVTSSSPQGIVPALTDADVQCSPARDHDADLRETLSVTRNSRADIAMNAVKIVLDVQTRVSDIQQQVRLLTEK